MHAAIKSFAIVGIDAIDVTVEVDVIEANSFDQAVWSVVGLGDTAVRESRDRVKAALKNSGFALSQRRVTVNLAPADLKKEGAHYDLPIALAILTGSARLDQKQLEGVAAIGELALDGTVRSVPGALPIAIGARTAGLPRLLVPAANAPEACFVEGIDIIPVSRLDEAVAFLRGEVDIAPARPGGPGSPEPAKPKSMIDFHDVRGQEGAKRALEIAAAGNHNVLLVGPPGSGKTMLSKRLPTILPELSFDEAMETTKIYSIAGLVNGRGGLVRRRPFRSPHHTSSNVALVGGGAIPKPGEVSLAHNGVLFLDELPEFSRNVLEVMRQPLEDGVVHVSRAQMSVTFPASFILCAAMNPCPCGYLGHPTRACIDSPQQTARYRGRISGPLLDRIDLHVNVSAVSIEDLRQKRSGESSATIRDRVKAARALQAERFAGTGIFCNGQMGSGEIRAHCALEKDAQDVLENAMRALNLSARAYDRILKVSRTIADLSGEDRIGVAHISEAVNYRTLDRGEVM